MKVCKEVEKSGFTFLHILCRGEALNPETKVGASFFTTY
jgi:hypothetical protein